MPGRLLFRTLVNFLALLVLPFGSWVYFRRPFAIPRPFTALILYALGAYAFALALSWAWRCQEVWRKDPEEVIIVEEEHSSNEP